MANISEVDKIEIKMMAEYLYNIDPVVYKWTQKFLAKDYLELKKELLAKDYLELKKDLGAVVVILDIKSLWIS